MLHIPWPTVALNGQPWDVVVLGAGPAGAIAARQLARAGHRVLLIDKSRFPRAKVCGGCLGGVALDVLETIGLGDLPLRAGGKTLRSMSLACHGSSATFPVGRRIAISREIFDHALVQEATCAGAIVCDETQGWLQAPQRADMRAVKLRRQGNSITVFAKAVLIATGLGRCPLVGRMRIGRRSRVGLGTVLDHSQHEIECDTLGMAVGASGYIGIAPVEGQRVDVAAAVDPLALAAAGSPGALVARILEEAGVSRAPLRQLATAMWRGTPRLTRHCRPLGADRCLLIGDAAGYVEPFTGEGIGWAMQSAVLASELVSDQLDRWDADVATRWHRLHRRVFGRSQWYCRAISGCLRYEMLSHLAISSLRRAPALARPVVRRIDRSTLPSIASIRTVQ